MLSVCGKLCEHLAQCPALRAAARARPPRPALRRRSPGGPGQPCRWRARQRAPVRDGELLGAHHVVADEHRIAAHRDEARDGLGAQVRGDRAVCGLTTHADDGVRGLVSEPRAKRLCAGQQVRDGAMFNVHPSSSVGCRTPAAVVESAAAGNKFGARGPVSPRYFGAITPSRKKSSGTPSTSWSLTRSNSSAANSWLNKSNVGASPASSALVFSAKAAPACQPLV